MLLVDRLKKQEKFSDTEKSIARYILEHPKEVMSLTIHELSHLAFTSPASISRFCVKLGVSGFSDLKMKLSLELSSFSVSGDRIATDLPFTQNQSAHEIMSSILQLNYQTMDDTFKNLDQIQMERIAKMIFKSSHIYLYGRGQSLIQALDFQYKLFRVGIDCNLESHNGFQLMKSSTQPVGSMALMISYYGVGDENFKIMKNLKSRGIKVILITGPETNRLSILADEVVHVPPSEKLLTKMASYSSRTAIQLVLDLLYALIFSLDYNKFAQIVELGNEK